MGARDAGSVEEYPALDVGWVLKQEPDEIEAQAMLTVAPDTYRWIVAWGGAV